MTGSVLTELIPLALAAHPQEVDPHPEVDGQPVFWCCTREFTGYSSGSPSSSASAVRYRVTVGAIRRTSSSPDNVASGATFMT